MSRERLLALVGPTASGKTEAAVELAEALGAEICCVDSMLVYRGMDIGTAKPTSGQRIRVPHHLIDLAEPSERFTVARFQSCARSTLVGVRRRGAVPLVVGGSGLYYRALVDDLAFPGENAAVRAELEDEARLVGAVPLYRRLQHLDPVAASKIEPSNVRRIVRALEVPAITGTPFSAFGVSWDRYDPARAKVVGIRIEPAVLARRIAQRVAAMLAMGWLDEVRGLVERGFGGWLTASQAIGYAELAWHLEGRLSLEEAREGTVRRTRNLARRQMAWFRRDPRVRWVAAGAGGATDVVDEALDRLVGA